MWMGDNIVSAHTHTCLCTFTVSKYKALSKRLTAPNHLDEAQKKEKIKTLVKT